MKLDLSRLIAILAVTGTSLMQAPLRAQSWQTEQIELTDGRVLRGLLEERDGQHPAFVQVRRRLGKPLALVVHPLHRLDITAYTPLDEDLRRQLRARIESLRNRAAIEAGRRKHVALEQVERDGIAYWSYDGPEFSLDASLDATDVRRVVVRLEQMFRAFGQVLPPPITAQTRRSPRGVSILIFGDQRQYAAHLHEQGKPFRNPAFFDPQQSRIVASTDLARLAQLTRKVEQQHLARYAQLKAEAKQFAQQAAQREEDLNKGGYTDANQRQRILLSLGRSFYEQQQAQKKRMVDIERRNRDAVFRERNALMSRLYHEAFHAYCHTRLTWQGDRQLPPWLAEGLAQVFESALFDLDVLRIDAPDQERLARLQRELASTDPLRLKDLITARESAFLVPHDRSGTASRRHYLYAWGLAYYLAFESGVGQSLARIALPESPDSENSDPIVGFEERVGMPINQFEAMWQKTMRSLDTAQIEQR